MNELMDRLARANPTPPDEPLTADEQREADALLERILADSPTVKAPRRTPTLRRLAPAAGLLAVLALAAVIVIDLLDSEERVGGIVERAVAAVSKDNVIWATTVRATSRTVALEPGVEASPDERVFARSWIWADADRSHAYRYRLRPDGSPGRLVGEWVSTPERITWFDAKGRVMLNYDRDRDHTAPAPRDEDDADDGSGYPGFDPSFDPGVQLREHVERDRLRVAGRTTVRGRIAYRLVGKAGSGEDFGTVTYLVDARTYLPLEVRQRVIFDFSDVPDGGRERVYFRLEYLRYEALPVNDRTKRLLGKGAGRLP
jgi:hypothetical protein